MNIKFKNTENSKLSSNEVNISLEYSNNNIYIKDFINYIKKYDEKKNFLIINQDGNVIHVNLKDIIMFFSDKKYNYCKTEKASYKIQKKLYELENISDDFIRISKSCIINVNHMKIFDISQTGRIVVKLDDNTEEFVSRRKIRSVMNFLKERRM